MMYDTYGEEFPVVFISRRTTLLCLCSMCTRATLTRSCVLRTKVAGWFIIMVNTGDSIHATLPAFCIVDRSLFWLLAPTKRSGGSATCHPLVRLVLTLVVRFCARCAYSAAANSPFHVDQQRTNNKPDKDSAVEQLIVRILQQYLVDYSSTYQQQVGVFLRFTYRSFSELSTSENVVHLTGVPIHRMVTDYRTTAVVLLILYQCWFGDAGGRCKLQITHTQTCATSSYDTM